MKTLGSRHSILVLACAVQVFANPISTGTAVIACSNSITFTTTCGTLASDVQTGFAVPSTTSFSGAVSLAGGSAISDMTGLASASAGLFKAYSSNTVLSGTLPTMGTSADAGAYMEDTLTILDPTLNGTAGNLILTLSIDATSNATDMYVGGVGTVGALYLYTGAPSSTGSVGWPPFSKVFNVMNTFSQTYSGSAIPFVFGNPFSIEIYFLTAAGASCQNAAACAAWSSSPVYVDAYNTAQLTGLTITDSLGNPISPANWSVVAESGLDYTPGGIFPSPEPSSLLLFAGIGGMMAVWTYARRKPRLQP